MTLTSNQYKQLLFQMLRRLFSRRNSNSHYVNALVYKVGSLLNDPSVVVQQSNYEELKEFFDRQTKYCYDNSIMDTTSYYNDENYETNFAEWQGLMANLGINISMGGVMSADLIVVMPDGVQHTIGNSYLSGWYINTKQGTSYSYSSLSDPYKYKYDVDNLPDLSDDDYKVMNSKCRWTYDESTKTVSIYGGYNICDDLEDYFYSTLGEYPSTVIINADITKFGLKLVDYVYNTKRHIDIIYLGAEDTYISIPSENFIMGGYISDSSKYYTDVTIYTDNKIMKNYNYPSNGTYTTITIKSLSEWQG